MHWSLKNGAAWAREMAITWFIPLCTGVLYIPGGAGFLPSTVSPDEMTQVPMIQRLVLRASMSSLQDSYIARCKEVLFGKCVISRTIDINPSCLCCFESPTFPSKYEYLYIVTESFDNACSSATSGLRQCRSRRVLEALPALWSRCRWTYLKVGSGTSHWSGVSW